MVDLNKFNPASINQQQGVVLVVSLVFLVALTAVAAALMQNSTTDIKMSGATEEKSVALQEVMSAADEVIFDELFAGNDSRFNRPITGDNFPVNAADLLPNTVTNSTAQITVANTSKTCPHSLNPSSDDKVSCNNFTVTTTRNYGRNNQNILRATSGIAQKISKN
jgi:Tfp pilus assembly protein PilX